MLCVRPCSVLRPPFALLRSPIRPPVICRPPAFCVPSLRCSCAFAPVLATAFATARATASATARATAFASARATAFAIAAATAVVPIRPASPCVLAPALCLLSSRVVACPRRSPRFGDTPFCLDCTVLPLVFCMALRLPFRADPPSSASPYPPRFARCPFRARSHALRARSLLCVRCCLACPQRQSSHVHRARVSPAATHAWVLAGPPVVSRVAPPPAGGEESVCPLSARRRVTGSGRRSPSAVRTPWGGAAPWPHASACTRTFATLVRPMASHASLSTLDSALHTALMRCAAESRPTALGRSWLHRAPFVHDSCHDPPAPPRHGLPRLPLPPAGAGGGPPPFASAGGRACFPACCRVRLSACLLACALCLFACPFCLRPLPVRLPAGRGPLPLLRCARFAARSRVRGWWVALSVHPDRVSVARVTSRGPIVPRPRV